MHVSATPELCVMDDLFEYINGFTNKLTPVIDTEGLMKSLSTKAYLYEKNLAKVYDPKQDFTDAVGVSAHVSEWAVKTDYLYSQFDQDWVYGPEHKAVKPYLVCMQKITNKMTKEQLAKFQDAVTKHNANHFLPAGEAFADLALDLCPQKKSIAE